MGRRDGQKYGLTCQVGGLIRHQTTNLARLRAPKKLITIASIFLTRVELKPKPCAVFTWDSQYQNAIYTDGKIAGSSAMLLCLGVLVLGLGDLYSGPNWKIGAGPFGAQKPLFVLCVDHTLGPLIWLCRGLGLSLLQGPTIERGSSILRNDHSHSSSKMEIQPPSCFFGPPYCPFQIFQFGPGTFAELLPRKITLSESLLSGLRC